jgi:hypothetical protein
MLREGPWKYIAHVGFRPQLFHLAEDPHEVADRAAAQPEVVSRLDAALRRIVDYEAVDAAAKATDAAEFATWRLRFAADGYLHALSGMVQRWDDDIAGRFAGWADAL